jgi:hypothetical protein
MTTDNWLMIVVIISTLIAPTVAVLVQSRMNQPRQTPVAPQPPSRIQRIGRRLNQAVPWVLTLSALISLWNLVVALRSHKPLDRWTVLIIAFSLSALVLNVAFLTFWFALRDVYKEFFIQAKFDRDLIEIIQSHLDATKTGDLGILELIKNLYKPPSEPPKPEPPERKP